MPSISLTVPAAPGTGPSVDAGQLARDRTVTYPNTGGGSIALEGSSDNVNFRQIRGSYLAASDTISFISDHRYLRVAKISGTGGTTSCHVEAQQNGGAQIVALNHNEDADSAANGVETACPFGQVVRRSVVRRVTITPDGPLTANETNFATIAVVARASDGTVRGTVASLTTNNDNWVANVGMQIPLVTTQVQAGDVFFYTKGKGGTGVVVPEHLVSVECEEI